MTVKKDTNTDEGIQKSDQNPKIQESKEIRGFKFNGDLLKRIYDYLNTRPYVEVDGILKAIEAEVDINNVMFSKEGMAGVLEYLSKKCPRLEVKIFLDEIKQGGISEYKLQMKE